MSGLETNVGNLFTPVLSTKARPHWNTTWEINPGNRMSPHLINLSYLKPSANTLNLSSYTILAPFWTILEYSYNSSKMILEMKFELFRCITWGDIESSRRNYPLNFPSKSSILLHLSSAFIYFDFSSTHEHILRTITPPNFSSYILRRSILLPLPPLTLYMKLKKSNELVFLILSFLRLLSLPKMLTIRYFVLILT